MNWMVKMMANFRSKYHSKKITRDGETFDSIKEYRRWCELKLLEKAGKIICLERQVKFVLVPAQYERKWDEKKGEYVKGKCIERECAYYADFVYMDAETGRQTVEDTKGFKTTEYVIKRKLMLYLHNIKIQEV